jgi:hypothetical protein
MRLPFWLLPLLSGCLLPAGNVLDCEAVALRGPDGDVDFCDDAACGSCVGTCGSGCMMLDDDARAYTCGNGDTWSADDLCQHWYD